MREIVVTPVYHFEFLINILKLENTLIITSRSTSQRNRHITLDTNSNYILIDEVI